MRNAFLKTFMRGIFIFKIFFTIVKDFLFCFFSFFFVPWRR